MPELPEVETVCRGLRFHLMGKRIEQYNQFRENLRWPIPHGIKGKLEGAVIKELDRRGKFLLFGLNNDQILIIHLGMSGRILVTEQSKKKNEQKIWSQNQWKLFKNPKNIFPLILRPNA